MTRIALFDSVYSDEGDRHFDVVWGAIAVDVQVDSVIAGSKIADITLALFDEIVTLDVSVRATTTEPDLAQHHTLPVFSLASTVTTSTPGLMQQHDVSIDSSVVASTVRPPVLAQQEDLAAQNLVARSSVAEGLIGSADVVEPFDLSAGSRIVEPEVNLSWIAASGLVVRSTTEGRIRLDPMRIDIGPSAMSTSPQRTRYVEPPSALRTSKLS
jgi:hypothetical protein